MQKKTVVKSSLRALGVLGRQKTFIPKTDKNNLWCAMIKCPNCRKELAKPRKSWSYGHFDVEAYTCSCGLMFREYKKDGKHSFMLKRAGGRKWIKPKE